MYDYNQKKEAARRKAREWQEKFAENNYSYTELIKWYAYFVHLGKKYGLLREFRENGLL